MPTTTAVVSPFRTLGIIQPVSMVAFGVLWAISFVGVAMCSDGGNVGYCTRLLGLWIASGIAAVIALGLAIPMLVHSRPADQSNTPSPAAMRWCLIGSALAWLVVLAFVVGAFSPIPLA